MLPHTLPAPLPSLLTWVHLTSFPVLGDLQQFSHSGIGTRLKLPGCGGLPCLPWHQLRSSSCPFSMWLHTSLHRVPSPSEMRGDFFGVCLNFTKNQWHFTTKHNEENWELGEHDKFHATYFLFWVLKLQIQNRKISWSSHMQGSLGGSKLKCFRKYTHTYASLGLYSPACLLKTWETPRMGKLWFHCRVY